MGIFSRLRGALGGSAGKGAAGRLSGYCDLRSDRLAGWVVHEFGSVKNSTEVQLVRRARLGVPRTVLAVCRAVPNSRERKYNFSMPVNGLVTGNDFVNEYVVVTAVNDAGDSGVLRLDGATQLELIRDHMGIPAVTILDLDFTRGGNSAGYLGSGWSGAEAHFTWTLDDESWLSFDSPRDPGSYALRFTTGAHIRPPHVFRQDMSIFLNDHVIGTIARTESFAQFEEFRFSSDVFAGMPRSSLRLYHPGAIRPCDFSDSKDSRRNGFSVKRIWLVRLIAPAA